MTDADGNLRNGTVSGWAWVALAAVIAAGAAARAWLLWSTSLIPGMNGGYYLIQSRALLEHGTLGIPDLPLTFLVQASFAKLLQLATVRSSEDCIFLSVRLCDAALPPLAAVPVFLLGRTWCARAGRGVWPAVAAAALVALGMPALSMVGDFEKNSLGMVWLAALVVALHGWMARRSRGRAAAVVAFLGLCGLTHIGVFGAALTLTALTWGADLALLPGKDGLKTLHDIGVATVAGAAMVALVAGIVLWKFDPARIQRLAGALSSPLEFLQTGGHNAGPGHDPGAFAPPRGAAGRLRPPPGMPGFADRRRMGPPGGGMHPGDLSSWPFFLAAAGALVLPLRRRRQMPDADRAVTIGCAVTLMILTGPWVGGDVRMRLQLIAMIPAAFAAAYVLANLPGRWTAPACSAALVALVAATSAPLVKRGGHPAISADALAELRALARYVAQPDRTLVVARHGLEWWTAWTLHTRVAQARAVRAADWSKYGAVYFIREKGGDMRGANRPEGNGPMGGPVGAPPMMGAAIPDGAEILHDGVHFTLARVGAPPEGQARSFGEMKPPDQPPPGQGATSRSQGAEGLSQ